jgi:hypothetical protein
MPLKPNSRRFFRFICGGKYSKRKLGKIFGVSYTHINRILFKFGKSRDTTFKIGVIVGTK